MSVTLRYQLLSVDPATPVAEMETTAGSVREAERVALAGLTEVARQRLLPQVTDQRSDQH